MLRHRMSKVPGDLPLALIAAACVFIGTPTECRGQAPGPDTPVGLALRGVNLPPFLNSGDLWAFEASLVRIDSLKIGGGISKLFIFSGTATSWDGSADIALARYGDRLFMIRGFGETQLLELSHAAQLRGIDSSSAIEVARTLSIVLDDHPDYAIYPEALSPDSSRAAVILAWRAYGPSSHRETAATGPLFFHDPVSGDRYVRVIRLTDLGGARALETRLAFVFSAAGDLINWRSSAPRDFPTR
jgi:hypothetical protein